MMFRFAKLVDEDVMFVSVMVPAVLELCVTVITWLEPLLDPEWEGWFDGIPMQRFTFTLPVAQDARMSAPRPREM